MSIAMQAGRPGRRRLLAVIAAGALGLGIWAWSASPDSVRLAETVIVSRGGMDQSPSLSIEGNTIDSGAGWRYVVDEVIADETSVTVRYHVEGDVAADLGQLPADAGEGEVLLPFVPPGQTGEVVTPRTGDSIAILGGPAARPSEAGASVDFTVGVGGEATLASITSTEVSEAVLFYQERGNFTSVRLTSHIGFTGRGSPGNGATLTDNLGNRYPLYHGSGTFPPKHSQWDFEGKLAEGVTSVRLDVPGSYLTERPTEKLQVPLR
ncbi:MAG: hypothetical protein ACKVVT_17305 [Dehalococcoidia bacterium]